MSSLSFLRRINFAEGTSYLLLLFVAMPLKYVAGQPLAVKYVGWAHGVLFCLFCLSLLLVMLKHRWHITRAALVFLSSLIPFGPWLIDSRLREWER
jgi:integral membrane protein